MEKQEFESREEIISQVGEIFNQHTRDGKEMHVVLHCLCNFTEFMEETLFDYRSYFQRQSREVIDRIQKSGAPEHEVKFITDVCDTVSEALIIAGQHGEGIELINKMRPELRNLVGLDDGE